MYDIHNRKIPNKDKNLNEYIFIEHPAYLRVWSDPRKIFSIKYKFSKKKKLTLEVGESLVFIDPLGQVISG